MFTKEGVFLHGFDDYVTFCDGSQLEDKEITLLLSPDISFRLEILAKQKGLSLSQYILCILSEHAQKHIPNNKDCLKKYFK
ncbi:MAG: hypothetical protein IJP05_06305 [Oscillospiraceae bacterium]|nr:hypothetical protein [Oscillospiraceae bacterium]